MKNTRKKAISALLSLALALGLLPAPTLADVILPEVDPSPAAVTTTNSSWTVDNETQTLGLSDTAARQVIGSIADSSIKMVLIGTTGGTMSGLPETADRITTKISSDGNAAMVLYDEAQTNDAIKAMLRAIRFSAATTQVHIDVTTGDTTDAIKASLSSTTFGVLNSNGEAHAYEYNAFTSEESTDWISAYRKAVNGTNTLGGLKGYLATVTTGAEAGILHEFYGSVTDSTQGAWIAGTSLKYSETAATYATAYNITPEHNSALPSDAYVAISDTSPTIGANVGYYYCPLDGEVADPDDYAPKYYWACGPEAGERVSSALWATNEPNNSDSDRHGEYCVVSSWNGQAKFNDLSPLRADVGGYFLEFSVYDGDGLGTGAKNSATIYKVSYDANGGTGTVPGPMEKFKDVALTLAGNTGGLAKTGCTFDGWNTNDAGTGTPYAAGADYSGNAALTLYAKWAYIAPKFDNDGYPYGKDMGTGQITLVCDVTNRGQMVSWRWQKSTNKETWSDIDGATSSTYGPFAPDSGVWYRCVVNGTASEPVQAVQPSSDSRTWTRPYSSNQWYLSNGKMAYTITAQNTFDVAGEYTIPEGKSGAGAKYMLQTSYSNGWQLYYGDNTGRGTPPTVQFKFDGSKPSEVTITAKGIEAGYNFALSCDTMIGNSTTSGYYADAAALVAQLNKTDQSLKQIAMIGAASEATAQPNDPAFVIAPATPANPMFWIGYWSSRQAYTYNLDGGSGTTKRDVLAHNGADGAKTNAVTSIEGRDSGMTMSWTNVQGGTVSFKFGVGSVADTGAIEAEIDYSDEKIKGLDPNTDYRITVLDVYGNESDTVYVIKALPHEAGHDSGTGYITLEGTAVSPSGSYDLIGKSIKITKVVEAGQPEPTPQTMDIAGRPTALTPNVGDEAHTASRPIEIKDEEVSVTARSVTLSIDPADEASAAKLAQEYQLVDESGNPIPGLPTWTKPDPATGKLTFGGLSPDTTYKLQARVPATNTAPASLPAEQTVKTAKEITVTEPSGDGLKAQSDGDPHSFPVTVEGDGDPEVAYSTALSEPYTFAAPSFTKGGQYTVYYRVTQDGSDPIYGNYVVTLDPKITFNANGGTVTLREPGEDGDPIDGNTVNVIYGNPLKDVVATATKETAPSHFAGWYTDAKLTNLYWFQSDFSGNTDASGAVLSDLTLYARWAQQLSDIAGNTAGVTKLRLQKGGVPVPSPEWADVDENGAFTIQNVPDDEYDMVLVKTVEDIEQTVTVRVKVENGEITFPDGTIAFPSKNISSKVTVEAGAPAAVVSGLAQETLATDDNDAPIHWDFSGDARNASSTLELIFRSSEDMTGIARGDAAHLNTNEEKTYAAQTAISSAAGSRAELEFFDISVIRTDTEEGLPDEVIPIGELQKPVEIAIPYAAPAGYAVKTYRYHVPEATDESPAPAPEMTDMTRLSARRSAVDEYEDGEFFVGDGVVYVYTKKFSAYAIAAIAPAPTIRSSGGGGGGGYAAGVSPTIQQSEHGTASVSPTAPSSGQRVTITVRPDAGYKLDALTVTDAGGKSVTLTKVNDTTYTYIQPVSKVTVNARFVPNGDGGSGVCARDDTCPISAYIDADPTAWYHDGLHWALENGVLSGVSPRQLSPNGDTSRAMIATMLWRLEGSPVVGGEMTFVDVADGMWYAEAIRWAASTGIITGYKIPAETAPWPMGFEPDKAVTREQLAAMLCRYAQYKGVDVSVGEDANLLGYGDAAAVSEYADASMRWAVGSGIVSGMTSGTREVVLAPRESASRAIVATMLMRYREQNAR